MHQIFTQFHLTISIEPSYMMSPSVFSQAPFPSNGVSPLLHCRTFSLSCLPIFFSLESSYLFLEDQNENDISIDFEKLSNTLFCHFEENYFLFPHTEVSSSICTCDFNRSTWSLAFNEFSTWTALSIKNFFY